MSKKSIEVLVGLFVLLGMAALVFLALKAANLASFGEHKGYTISAKFDNIGGLKPSALDPKTYQGLVRLEIDNFVKFPKDTSAKILTAGLLGDQYIGLEPGAAEKELAAGDVITQTQSAVVLENLIGQFLYGRTEGDPK